MVVHCSAGVPMSSITRSHGVPLGSLCTDVNKCQFLLSRRVSSQQCSALVAVQLSIGLQCTGQGQWLASGVQSSCQRGRPSGHWQACRHLGGRLVEGTFTLNPE